MQNWIDFWPKNHLSKGNYCNLWKDKTERRADKKSICWRGFFIKKCTCTLKKNMIINHWLLILSITTISWQEIAFKLLYVESLLTRSSLGNLLESVLGKRKYFSTINSKKWANRPLQLYLLDKKGLARSCKNIIDCALCHNSFSNVWCIKNRTKDSSKTF